MDVSDIGGTAQEVGNSRCWEGPQENGRMWLVALSPAGHLKGRNCWVVAEQDWCPELTWLSSCCDMCKKVQG